MPYKTDSLTFEILDKGMFLVLDSRMDILKSEHCQWYVHAYGGDLLGIKYFGKLIVNNIPPGNNYLITAFDANQCKGSIRVNISEPAKLDVKTMVVQPD